MLVIEVKAPEIIISNIPWIAAELRRIGDLLEGKSKDVES